MIKTLELRNFRNYSQLRLEFNKSRNIFIGSNGQGKTNILESLYFLSILRSFRTSSIKSLTKINSQGFYIGADIKDSSTAWSKKLEVEYSSSRILKIDSKRINKASVFINNVKTVTFTPGDIDIVIASSALRRRFINIFISTLIPEYLNALSEYLEALKTRNIMLKNGATESEFIVFEHILAEKGSFIVSTRSKIFKKLSEEMLKIYLNIKDDIDSFFIKYSPVSATSSGFEEFFNKLHSSREKDKNKGYTPFGPHCDDFDFLLNGQQLRQFGSNGQCRLAAICLKMAAISILTSNNFSNTAENNNITVLVDDVTGDLDERTKDAFFKTIESSEQIFFTFTEKPRAEIFNDANSYLIENGKIQDS